MDFLIKFNQLIKSNNLLAYFLIVLISLAVFSWLQFNPVIADPDSFYHIKIADLMKDTGVIFDFPWLQETVLSDGYVDHHFLYHLFLVPFIALFGSILGAKVAQVFFGVVLVVTFFWLLRQLKVNLAFWWVIFLFFISSFIFRISLIKAQSLVLIFLFLIFYFINQRRLWPLLVFSFFYVWLYNGWFLVLFFGAFFVLADAIYAAIHSQSKDFLSLNKAFFNKLLNKNNLLLLGSIISGLLLGIIINPYFPQNIDFFVVHILEVAFKNYQNIIKVGMEWYPYSSGELIIKLGKLLLVSFFALFLSFDYYKKISQRNIFLAIIFLFFLLITIRAKRNLEYLVPFGIIFSASVFSHLYQNLDFKTKINNFTKLLKKSLSVTPEVKKIMSATIIVTLFGGFYLSILSVRQSIYKGFRIDYLKNASIELKNISQPGDVVFHSSWDEFPMMFYYNTSNYYIVGLDPTFMYLKDKTNYIKWWEITRGKHIDEMYKIIKQDFGAKYVFTTVKHKDFIWVLDNNFYFKKIYQDNEAIIYQVL